MSPHAIDFATLAATLSTSAASDLASASAPVHPTARRASARVRVASPHVTYAATGAEQEPVIRATYQHTANLVTRDPTPSSSSSSTTGSLACSDAPLLVTPTTREWGLQTRTRVPRTGLMLVGWGGNNGSTLTASLAAHALRTVWHSKTGAHHPNFLGSLIRASTVRLGTDPASSADVNLPWSDLLPLLHPTDLVLSGWDISAHPIDRAMARAQVLPYDLQRQLAPHLADLRPLPSIHYPTFLGPAMTERADNLLPPDQYPTKASHLAKLRADIRAFKAEHDLETVIVLWSASTERFVDQTEGLNDTADALLAAIEADHPEVSPSTVFAVASVLEHAVFINGAPQNTILPGVIDLAQRHGSFLAGDDFKSGQTKLKSVLADYLVNAGIKPLSIASYNHLGNADGANLQSEPQFKSKERTKRNVIDDLTEANHLLYKPADRSKGETQSEHPDHIIVIKYLPAVGDSKRAIDEYNSEIFMGGRNVLSIYNVCEDSLLAVPLILDLVILAELMTRVTCRNPEDGPDGPYKPMHSVLSLLSYMTKAPLCKPGHEVVNSLARQRGALEAFFKACIGLAHTEDLNLDSRTM